MRRLHLFLVPFACLLAACGPSEGEVAEAERAKAARAAAGSAGLAEAPVDLGEGLILTVLERGTGSFVPSGGRVRVHYDASVVAVTEAPVEEPPAEEPPSAEGAPVDEAAPAVEGATESGGEPVAETAGETPAEPATEGAQEAAPESEAASGEVAPESQPAADEVAPEPAPVAQGGAEPAVPEAGTAEPAAQTEVPPVEAVADTGTVPPEFPRRFDSSRARGVPDTWDLSRTASPRLIDGLRRGLVGLTAGSRVTLRVPAALAWGDEGLPDAGVPPRADVLYEIELIEVLP
jgi:FKBP-type peptidyl-prolyl cis-trans isomerase